MKIVLIGFMGTGKTSVSEILSRKLDMERIETDDLVVKKSGTQSVKEIFSKDGEIRFRELEIEIAKEIRGKDNVIISTGGGIVMNKIIIDFLRENGKVIFLKTSFSEIERRLKNDISRPLFQDKIRAKQLFNFRRRLYKEYADLIVTTDGKSVEKIAYEIVGKK